MPYDGYFSNWRDVVHQFYGVNYATEAEQKKALENCPEPEEVIVAVYEYESYDGTAVVVYRNGETYYSVYGSHCSCHGLEDQFDPEEHSAIDALNYWKRMAKDGYGIQKTLAPQIIKAIEARIFTDTPSIQPASVAPARPAHFGRF